MSIDSVSTSGSNVQADSGQAQSDSVEETTKAASGKGQDERSEESATSESGDQDQGEENDAENQDDQGDEDSVKDDESKPKRNKVKNRIDKLRSRISERDLMIAERDREIEFLRKQSKYQDEPDVQESKAAKPSSSIAKPSLNDFDSHEAYVEAVADWKYEVREADRKAKEEEARLKESYAKRTADHLARVKEYEASNPGYKERVTEFLEDYGTNGDYRFSPALAEAFTEESGPVLMDELLKNPEELVRINGLSYGAALRALGKIEARIQSSKETSTSSVTKTSKAPPPVSPIGKGAAPVAKSLSDPNLSFSDYERLRKQQLNKRK